MCDGIHDPGGPRRCPSQRGHRRRDYRRALYAAKKAAAAQTLGSPTPPAADPVGAVVPTIEQVQESITAAEAAWFTYSVNSSPENARAYETAVRRVGEQVAAQVDNEVDKRLGDAESEFQRIAQLRTELDAEIDAFARDKEAYQQWSRSMSPKLPRMSFAEQNEVVKESQARVDELNARSKALTKRRQDLDGMAAERGVAEGRIATEVLAAYRAYGTTAPSIHQSSSKRAHDLVADASRSFPDDWAKSASEGMPMVVKESKKRAFYQGMSLITVTEEQDYDYSENPAGEQEWPTRKAMPPAPEKSLGERMAELGQPRGVPKWVAVRSPETGRWRWKLRVTDKGAKYLSEMRVPTAESGTAKSHRTTVHELSHRVEARHPRLSIACIAFRDRRTTNPDGSRHRQEVYGPGEYVRPDDFVTSYIGKHYDSSVHTEVLSMGMESVFAGSQGSLKGYQGHKADREHRNLILGLCASA
ncbi:hypothetical protein [Prescottella agglutinans]|uniref:Uncharacterized protein n=1 Tax=Prescottella agglutinans TaxID=1644129 RepID=A0ABT6MI39_9NOCA|nr:hypothetical protein [Prescottella agglutinans]MDH6283982.1 hypothetical protein [Prescottella agglutinans]